MRKEATILFLLYISLFDDPTACLAAETANVVVAAVSKPDPFSPKSSLLRYWRKRVSSHQQAPPQFLLSKCSPLNAINSAIITHLVARNALTTHLNSFCAAANLFCTFDQNESTRIIHDGVQDANFTSYGNKKFASYGSDKLIGSDTFANYSDGLNLADNSFTRYSRDSTGHSEQFTNYAPDSNVATGVFVNYGSGATGGSGVFKNYDKLVNVPKLRFTTYDSDGNDHKLGFTSYSDDTNSGDQSFTTYGKNGNGVPNEFNSYGTNGNTIGSTFSGYGLSGNGANDTFKGYGRSGNNPRNNFKGYGNDGNSAIDNFANYRDGANTGEDTFISYGKDSNSEKATFINYGKTFNPGLDTFKEYGKDAHGQLIGFKMYGLNTTFKGYSDKGVSFAQYTNTSSNPGSSSVEAASLIRGGNIVNRGVETGKFFRESMLREGNIMTMPDITDKMPRRSFLPRAISSKIPFTTSRIAEIKQIFHANDNSTMAHVITKALAECERPPSQGESKKCVGSIEDMLDFAISILGHKIAVGTTESTNGSRKSVMMGKVRGINGGKLTKSVSCHQSMYPYLLYYCHAVPEVRVYEAEILDVQDNDHHNKHEIINNAVAICHIDTSAWSQGHGAFVALGSSPGLIEVCHWIFENDMTWTIVD